MIPKLLHLTVRVTCASEEMDCAIGRDRVGGGVTLRSRGHRGCYRTVVGLIAVHSMTVDMQEMASIDHIEQ